MITRSTTKQAETVLKINEKFVASSVSAQREGEAWAQRHREQVLGFDCAIVLGVGCGYHLAALQSQHPHLKVIGIDCVPDFIQFTQNEHSIRLVEARYVVATTIHDLQNSSELQQALSKGYTLLSFQPAQIANPAFYVAATGFLTARTLEGFYFLTSLRSELDTSRSLGAVGVGDHQYLSIKDLTSGKMRFENQKTKQVLAALRELVV